MMTFKSDPAEAVDLSYMFNFPDGDSPAFEIGTISKSTMTVFYIPRYFVISVTNGGPESLVWTAALKNNTSNEIISDYTKFTHGDNGLTVIVYSNSISEDDNISVILHNDTGTGQIIATGTIAP